MFKVPQFKLGCWGLKPGAKLCATISTLLPHTSHLPAARALGQIFVQKERKALPAAAHAYIVLGQIEAVVVPVDEWVDDTWVHAETRIVVRSHDFYKSQQVMLYDVYVIQVHSRMHHSDPNIS